MGVVYFVILVLMVSVATLIASAIVLGLGTLLSMVFPVGLLGASAVALVVGVAIVWFLANTPAPPGIQVEEGEEEEEGPVRILAVPFPLERPARKRRK